MEIPVVVGDSTGANFAYQLRERRLEKGKKSILILGSPLLDIDERIADFDFPEKIIPELKKYDSPEDALIIATKNDTILNQKWLFQKKLKMIKLIEVNYNHRLEKFHEILPLIDSFYKVRKAIFLIYKDYSETMKRLEDS